MSDRGLIFRGKGVRRRTPISERGMRLYDALPPDEAARRAWVDPGLAPDWHEAMKAEVASHMPLLARALDRLAAADRRRSCGR
jgi:hypothetical protein